MEKKWYQYWRSWITILLLLFTPTFLIGLIVMWLVAPWSKRAKWWVTGIGLGLAILGILVSLVLVLATPSPVSHLSAAKDTVRRSGVQEISGAARQFCLEKGRCPTSILEIQQEGYLKRIPVDPDTKANFSYQLTNNGQNCIVKTTLSTKKVFSRDCIPNPNSPL